MDPIKVGKFIKELRTKNNLTQNEFAEKYGVTYQAVSKWENGLNLPDLSLLKQISKDYNISIDAILEGKNNDSHKQIKHHIYIIILLTVFLVLSIVVLIKKTNSESFKFKTLTTTCQEFRVSGSIAYNKSNSSIYISNIDYCGGNDKTVYDSITCTLYENNDNSQNKISSCNPRNNITLEEYLKNIELNVDSYMQKCRTYTDKSLYLEINATEKSRTVTYKVPLKLNNNCPK